MRQLAALAICAGLSISAYAQSLSAVLTPSPLTILLTIGKWIKKDQVEVFYVQVQAHGRDEQDARNQAFRLAVDQAVGSLLLSQTKVSDGELRRHEIINYSSGYVQDFKILDRVRDSSGITIKIDVWVSRSNIADRLLSESRTEGKVEGGRITEQIRSFQRERQGADSVIDAVLKDYPHRAFDVVMGKTSVIMDEQRRPVLRIPVRISWNQRFVESFLEATKAVNQHPECGGWIDPCVNKRYTRVGRGYFDDDVIQMKAFRAMIQSHARVRIMSPRNTVQISQCFEVPELGSGWSPWKFADVGGGVVQINNGRWKDYVFGMDLSQMSTDQLDRVEVSIQRDCAP